jgi:hypothetical protein
MAGILTGVFSGKGVFRLEPILTEAQVHPVTQSEDLEYTVQHAIFMINASQTVFS